MNTKEIGELRRHLRRERCNMTAVYGCYVNDNKEIISEFRQSTGMMSENEAERYFSLFKRTLSGSLGKNLIDISFKTAQVVDSEEHSLLMKLRNTALSDAETRQALYKKIIETVSFNSNYLILLGCDSYDVPFKNSSGESDTQRSDETYTYLICAVCPVKQNKSVLSYIPEEKEFHDGGITNTVSAPEIGFLFPAFDNRGTNIYNALYYTHSPKNSHADVAMRLFCNAIPAPAAEQKKTFEALLGTSLGDECSMDVLQTVHEQLSQRIALHKESRVPEALTVSKDEVKEVLSACGVTEPHVAKFSVEYDSAFGFEAQIHPRNIIDERHFQIKTADVSITVAPDRLDLIETRVIGGVKYILICAEDNVEVNGVNIQIGQKEAAEV